MIDSPPSPKERSNSAAANMTRRSNATTNTLSHMAYRPRLRTDGTAELPPSYRTGAGRRMRDGSGVRGAGLRRAGQPPANGPAPRQREQHRPAGHDRGGQRDQRVAAALARQQHGDAGRLLFVGDALVGRFSARTDEQAVAAGPERGRDVKRDRIDQGIAKAPISAMDSSLCGSSPGATPRGRRSRARG